MRHKITLLAAAFICGSFDYNAICAEPPKAPEVEYHHAFGWVEDKGGVKDRNVVHAPSFAAARILPAVDLRQKMPPVYDQGQIGSCTGNGTACVLDYAHVLNSGARFFTPSRLFIYYGAREMEGTENRDAGAQIRDVVSIALRLGAPPETTWPYITSRYAVRPSNDAYDQALRFQALHAYKVDNNDNSQQVRQALSGGMPVIFGCLVYQDIENLRPANYRLPMPRGRPIGGHCMVLVGYSNADGSYICRQSWGTAYGNKGYILVPFAYIDNPRITSDLWVVDKAE